MKEHGFLYVSYYDYGFRQLDPQLGRWHVVDPLAEVYHFETPYGYAGNNPISNIDILGLGYTYDWDAHNNGNTGVYLDDDGNQVGWDAVFDWIQGGLSDGSMDGFSITGDFSGNGQFNVTLSGGQSFSMSGLNNVSRMINLGLEGYNFTMKELGGDNVLFFSKGELGKVEFNNYGEFGLGWQAENETAGVLAAGTDISRLFGEGGLTLKTPLGAVLMLLGDNSIGTRGKVAGATEGTSIASRYLSKKLPQRLNKVAPKTWNIIRKVVPKKVLGQSLRSPVLGRMLGRAVPIVGEVLIAIDAAQFVYKDVLPLIFGYDDAAYWEEVRRNSTTIGLYNE